MCKGGTYCHFLYNRNVYVEKKADYYSLPSTNQFRHKLNT